MPWSAAQVAAVALAAAPPPLAYPAFPANTDFTTVSRWAGLQTNIPAGDLLDVREGFAFVVLPASRTQGLRRIRLEAVEPRAWAALGGRSADIRLQLSCAPDSARPVGFDLYSASNRKGEVRRGLPPQALPVSDAAFGVLASVLCSPALLARPLITDEEERAQASPPPAPDLATAASPKVVERPVVARRRLAAVQIGAFASRTVAETALLRLRVLRPSLEPRIELSGAAKAPVFRALLTGFATRKEAAAFCRDLNRQHRTCLVRGAR